MNISSIRFTIGIGKTKDGNPIGVFRRQNALQKIRESCAKNFGGWTETSASGGWWDAERKVLVIEQSVVIEVAVLDSADQDQPEAIKEIVDLAKSDLDQECVLVQVIHGTSELA